MLYVSRFSNPELRSGKYTAVRISIGAPKWPLGYEVAGEIKDLMPWGLLNKFSHEEFVPRYRARLDSIGVDRIWDSIKRFEAMGKPVVLLCYEDVRVPGQTCHRTTFAEWWLEQTGEIIEELPDPSTPKTAKKPEESKPALQPSRSLAQMNSAMKRAEERIREREAENMQISMFGNAVW